MPIITTKLLGCVAGGLGILCLLLVGFGTVQTKRLSEASRSIKTLLKQADDLTTIANQRATELQARDAIIMVQSASVQALKDQATKDRTAYLGRVEAARSAGLKDTDRAQQIIQLPAPPADQQCEAARKLILEELTNGR